MKSTKLSAKLSAKLSSKPSKRFAFYEFFAGGGMARAGLGAHWRCAFANDIDSVKRAVYAANWGDAHLHAGDIAALAADDLPATADMAWASFPCQDLSLAGRGAGLSGARSGTFWPFWSLVRALGGQGRAPRLLVLENVVGALSSNGGRDFAELCRALCEIGYGFGALTIDAAHFVPQSRPRLFIVAMREGLAAPAHLTGDGPAQLWANSALLRAHAALPDELRACWRWWALPAPAASNVRLADLIEEAPADVRWHSPEETARLVALMAPANLRKLEAAMAAGARQVGTLYRRTRRDGQGRKAQRAEVRFDGVAGCLRTPSGGSSRQCIVVVDGDAVRTRLLSGREAARLMGLPDEYRLPANYNDAYHVLGDGLVAPAIRHLDHGLLTPLLAYGQSGAGDAARAA